MNLRNCAALPIKASTKQRQRERLAMDHFRPRALARALAACSMLSLLGTGAAQAQALPTGATVTSGQASIVTNGNRMTVTNSNGAVIDWRSFSIGAGQAVRFDQSNASSQVLNRVVGNDSSSILGSLSSNGKVWLLNPNGVLFGHGARVDVAGLVASTLSLSNSDWLAGRYQLSAVAGAESATVNNQGELRTPLGGRIVLLGGKVQNEGLIEAPGGQIVLAAGSSVDLVDTGAPNLTLRVTADKGEVLNLGSVNALGGRIDIQSAVVNQHGIVRAESLTSDAQGRPLLAGAADATGASRGTSSIAASSATADGGADTAAAAGATAPAGEVVLKASQTLELGAGSVTSAAGDVGGQVTIDGGSGVTWVRGSVTATAASGNGGQIKLLGRQVGLADGSLVDTSGAQGGGQILVGGGQEGKDPSVPNAEAVYVAPGAVLKADATAAGDGGRLIVWSDQSTRAYGSFSARGGDGGGNGGFVETSGGWLDAQPARLDLSAAKGSPGRWLLDPYDILITDAVTGSNFATGPLGVFSPIGPSSVIPTAVINSALATGANVTISTGVTGQGGDAGTQPGDITVRDANILGSAPLPTALTLNAARNVVVQRANVGGNLTLNVNAARQANLGGVSITGSTINPTGDVNVITAFGGTVLPDLPGAFASIYVSDSLVSPLGSLTLTGGAVAGGASGLLGRGIVVTNVRLGGASISIRANGIDVSRGASSSDVSVLISESQIQSLGPVTLFGFGIQGAFLEGTIINAGDVSIQGNVYCGCQGFEPRSIYLYSSAAGTPTSINSSGGVSLLAYDSGFGSTNIRSGNFFDIASGSTVTSASGIAISARLFNSIDPLQYPGARVSGKLLAGGQIRIDGSNIRLDGSISSTATGTAITVAPSGPIALAQVSASGLQAPNGRWLVYGNDPSTTLVSGSVAFKQYNAVSTSASGTPAAGGNGVLYALAPTLTLSGTAVDRPYDGTTNLAAGALDGLSTVGLVPGDRLASVDLAQVRYADKNVGTRSIRLTPASVSVVDANGVPVLNYGLLSNVTGVIAPAVLSILANSASKSYGTSLTFSGNEFTSVGLRAGETIGRLSLSSSGAVATASVAGGPYSIIASNATGGTFDPRNYTVTYGNGTLAVTPASLQAALTGNSTKTYDGSDTALLSPSQFVVNGFVAGQGAIITGTQGRYDSANAGARSVTVMLGREDLAPLAGTDLRNYVLPVSATGAGTILPKTLNVVGAVADSKSYDGNTAATISRPGTLDGLVSGQLLALTPGTAQFEDKDVGLGKRVIISGLELADGTGLAGNYRLASSTVTTVADIRPATLVYTAAPATAASGGPLPPLSGTVGGFVAGESVGTATTGTLSFTTPATSSSPNGAYSINGGGLAAANYVFTQAPGNATALVLSSPPAAVSQSTSVALAATAQQIALPVVATSPTEGRTLDAVQAVSEGTSSDKGLSFRSVSIRDMSQDALAALLASRDQFKRGVFAASLSKLEQDPSLADVRDCKDVKQLEQGTCLITEALKAGIANARRLEELARAPASNETSAASATSPRSSSSTTSAAAEPTAAAVAAITEKLLQGVSAADRRAAASKRRVVMAAVPQIARKLALVIGVDAYADKRIPQLDNAVSDARAVAKLLEASLGYETVVMPNASKEAIVAALNKLAAEVDTNDSVIVYYAGHGAVVESTGLGYWQPANATADKPESWLSNTDITKLIGQIGASQVALVSDSCYSGSLVTSQRIRASTATSPQQFLSQKSVVIMASGGNEPVFDSGRGGHSPFAWNLMRALENVSGWQAGGNVFERVRFAVARELPQRPQYGAVAEAGHQAGGDYLFEQRELGARDE